MGIRYTGNYSTWVPSGHIPFSEALQGSTGQSLNHTIDHYGHVELALSTAILYANGFSTD